MHAHSKQKNLSAIIQNNAQFESMLSVISSSKSNLTEVLSKVGETIKKIVSDHKEEIIHILQTKPPGKTQTTFEMLMESLYGDFCALPKLDKPSEEKVLNQIVSTLTEKEKATHAEKMPLVGTFNYRIVKALFPKQYSESEAFFKKVEDLLFNKDKNGNKLSKRGITEVKGIAKTFKLGICHEEKFQAELNQLPSAKLLLKLNNQPHLSSIGRFTPDQVLIDLYKESPLVAGPSTHTFSMFAALLTYEKLNFLRLSAAEKRELALAYAMYLVAAGYHSLDSVMVMAELCIHWLHFPEKLVVKQTEKFPTTLAEAIECINYNMAQYRDKIPSLIKESFEYKLLCDKFPRQTGAESALGRRSVLSQNKDVGSLKMPTYENLLSRPGLS